MDNFNDITDNDMSHIICSAYNNDDLITINILDISGQNNLEKINNLYTRLSEEIKKLFVYKSNIFYNHDSIDIIMSRDLYLIFNSVYNISDLKLSNDLNFKYAGKFLECDLYIYDMYDKENNIVIGNDNFNISIEVTGIEEFWYKRLKNEK